MCQLLMLLLLIKMVPTHSWLMTLARSSSMANELSWMIQGVYQGIHLAVLFRINESFIILYLWWTICKGLAKPATCLLISYYKLYGKLYVSVPIIPDDNLRVKAVECFGRFWFIYWECDTLKTSNKIQRNCLQNFHSFPRDV